MVKYSARILSTLAVLPTEARNSPIIVLSSLTAVKPFHPQEPPEHFLGTSRHYWGEPHYHENILRFFVILNHEGKIVDNPGIAATGQFFIAVIVAKMRKYLMENRKSLDVILSRVKKDTAKYYQVLSLKYHLSQETCLSVV